MPTRTYKPFDVWIDPDGDGYRVRITQSPAGEGQTSTFKMPFTAEQLEMLRHTPAPLMRHFAVDDGSRPSLAGHLAVEYIGERLYQAIFSGDIGRCLLRSQDMTRMADQSLRVRLHLTTVPMLAQLPWEFMYDPNTSDNRYLALSRQTSIVRYLDLDTASVAMCAELPLTVLGIVSNPCDAPGLDVEGEWERLEKALASMVKSGYILLERLPQATTDALQIRLLGRDVHVLHYIGHGYFDEQVQVGGLVFEDASCHSKRVSATQIGVLLRDHPSLRLAFLNACEGARGGTTGSTLFAGVAQQLVEQGLPTVLAMQYPVSDTNASILAEKFYQTLANGYPVDGAVAEARKTVFTNEQALSSEWGTPVLFSRSADSQLWELPPVIVRPDPQWFEPEVIWLPAGQFTLGHTPALGIPDYETPEHAVMLPNYFIARCPTTNRQYHEFVRATGRLVHPEALWNGQVPPNDQLDRPMTGVTFYDALSYCSWLSKQTGQTYRLPNEAEWEKAAQVAQQRGFERSEITEWTATLWGELAWKPDPAYRYPWHDDDRNDTGAGSNLRRVIRGGDMRATGRRSESPDEVGPPSGRVGFRVVWEAPHAQIRCQHGGKE